MSRDESRLCRRRDLQRPAPKQPRVPPSEIAKLQSAWERRLLYLGNRFEPDL
jgi:hypothetical protein